MKDFKLAIAEICELLERKNITITKYKNEDFVFTQKIKGENDYNTKKIWAHVETLDKDTIKEILKGD